MNWVIVVASNAFEWLQKEGVTKDPGATGDKLAAQPGREGQSCNPDPTFPPKSYVGGGAPAIFAQSLPGAISTHWCKCTLSAVVS